MVQHKQVGQAVQVMGLISETGSKLNWEIGFIVGSKVFGFFFVCKCTLPSESFCKSLTPNNRMSMAVTV